MAARKTNMRVVMFKTSDGTLFEDAAKADRYEGGLKIAKGVNEIIDSTEDSGIPVAIDRDELVEFIKLNAEELYKVLQSAMPERRGRKKSTQTEGVTA